MIRRIISCVEQFYYKSSSDRYIKFLRSKGVLIGGGNHIDPKTSVIDISRPSLVSIGNNCYMNRNFILLTHDWVTKVFIESGRDFLPSSGRVRIGNNVSFGQNVMVLKGVTIGDNCFIGAGSIVTKDIPANSVAVGTPCKAIMSLDDFYKKRMDLSVQEALEYARSIKERFNRRPVVTDFWEEFPLFVDGDKINEYPELKQIIRSQCGCSYDNYVKAHKAMFDGFDDFLEAAKV